MSQGQLDAALTLAFIAIWLGSSWALARWWGRLF